LNRLQKVPLSRLFTALLLLLLIAPSVSLAQAPDSLVKWQRVRVVTRCLVVPDQTPDCSDGDARWTYIGQLETLDRGDLHLRSETNQTEFVIPRTSITHLYVTDGTKGHFWPGAGIGLVGGALIGAVVGSTTEFCIDSCTPEAAQAGAIEAGVIIGAPVGFLLGGVVGSLIRSERWRLICIDDHLISAAPRISASEFAVDLRF
jgi:hypothetical protein